MKHIFSYCLQYIFIVFKVPIDAEDHFQIIHLIQICHGHSYKIWKHLEQPVDCLNKPKPERVQNRFQVVLVGRLKLDLHTPEPDDISF